MKVPTIAATVIALGAIACLDATTPKSKLTPTSGRYDWVPGSVVSFDVTGFTYGPDGYLEVMPPSCATLTTYDSSFIDFPSPKESGQPAVYIGQKRGTSCGIGADSAGSSYLGGTISITGYTATQSVGFGSTDARWDETRSIVDFPSSATVVLTPWPDANGACPSPTFLNWVIDNDFGNARADNPLVISATALNGHRVMGQFACKQRSGGGGTPSDTLPPGYYYCDDPSSDPMCIQGNE